MTSDQPAAKDTPVLWDIELFLRFENERMRPARDLTARLDDEPHVAYDLGCGTGGGAKLLALRFPTARIVGIDSSDRMVEEARKRVSGVEFRLLDIVDWSPDAPADLIFSDNALQWVPDHDRLFPRLMNALAPGGTLAIEMPDNHQEPSHVLMRLLAADGPWADRLVPVAKTRAVISSHEDYYNWLKPLASDLEMWRTTYIHPLAGVDALVDWFRGSVLLPYLAPLTASEQETFLTRYKRELEEAYPAQPDGRLLLLLPRLFIIARKPG